MPLDTRLITATDYEAATRLVIESFEPITWQKKLDVKIGPLNGRDWRERWRARLANIFATQIVLVGEAEGQLAAFASATLDRDSAHEILARKLQAGAEQAERERLEKEAAARAAADEKERRRAEAQAEREARATTRAQPRTPQRREKSMVEQITDSSAFKQFARTAGTEIVRSIFGTARRRRR